MVVVERPGQLVVVVEPRRLALALHEPLVELVVVVVEAGPAQRPARQLLVPALGLALELVVEAVVVVVVAVVEPVP